MSKIKTKELIICLISIIFLILTLVTDVFASEEIPNLNNLIDDANNNSLNYTNIQSGNNNTTNNLNNTNNTTNNLNNTNNTTNNLNNTNSNRNNTTKIPDTGVDYSVVFIIAICGISAIYAYKKIRDYNNL